MNQPTNASLPPTSVRKASQPLLKCLLVSGLSAAVLFGLSEAGYAQSVQDSGTTSESVTQGFTESSLIRGSAPRHYEVKPGDTLWGISSLFLNDPWMWPLLWKGNPQLDNPNQIYPGDQLTLFFDNKGQPKLQKQESGVVKLSPGIRVSEFRQSIPTIPLKAIQSFVERHQVFLESDLLASAQVLGAQDGRIVAGAGDRVYVTQKDAVADGTRFLVYRQQQPYLSREPSSKGQLLGIEMKYVATLAQESSEDGVAVMRVLQARQEVRTADLVTLQDRGQTPSTFYPAAPPASMQGEVISVLSGVRYAGANAVVAINLGTSDKLKPGHVFKIQQRRNLFNEGLMEKGTLLPAEDVGQLMVFRTFDQVSYALIMDAQKPIAVGDRLTSPEF